MSPEKNLDPGNEYRRSAEYMFGLLADTQAKTSPQFYIDSWDEVDPTALHELTTMTLAPTGARRDQRWGRFYSAQFVMTETSSAGDASQRFVWCYTGPANTGSAINVDVPALAQEYGYKEIVGINILSDLASRATGPDNHLTLVHLMQEYDVPPTRTLTTQVNRLVTRFVNQQIVGTPETDPDRLDPDKMFELISRFLALDSRVQQPISTESHVMAPILKAIAQAKTFETSAPNAATLLETILTQNIIPDGSAKDRAFASVSIYRYPFAVDALYDYLARGGEGQSEGYIFGIRRLSFVGTYVTTMMQIANPALAEQITQIRDDAGLHEYSRDYFNKLHCMIDQLVDLVNKNFPDPTPVSILEESSLSYIGRGFANVLARLNGRHYKEDEALLHFDTRNVRIVEHILAPLYRSLGTSLLTISGVDR